jgi:hypothetical protein
MVDCEHSSKQLPPLYSQRGDFDKTELILQLDLEVLLRYEEMTTRIGDPESHKCCATLRHKYENIRYNLLCGNYTRTRDINSFARDIPPLLRSLMRHEIVCQYTYEEQYFAFLLTVTDATLR